MNKTELARNDFENQLIAIDRRLGPMINAICHITVCTIEADVTDLYQKIMRNYFSFAENLEWLQIVLARRRSKLLKGDLSKLRNFTKETEEWLIGVNCKLQEFVQAHELLERLAEFDTFAESELKASRGRKRQLRRLLRRASSASSVSRAS